MGHSSGKEQRAKLIEIARRQHGVFTLGQAVDAGLSRRQVYRVIDNREWTALLPGVFGTAPRVDWMARVMAACLWAGDGAVASHRTAAVLWELDGIVAKGVEITTSDRKDSPRKWLVVRTAKHVVTQRPASTCDPGGSDVDRSR